MKRHLFRRMGRFLRPQASSLAGAAALAALSGLLALLVPLVAGWAVEAIGTGPGAADLTAVLRYCAAGLGAAVLSAVCSYGASAALVRVGQTVSYTLRKAAFQQITQLPVRYFDTHPAGDLISRVSRTESGTVRKNTPESRGESISSITKEPMTVSRLVPIWSRSVDRAALTVSTS